MLATLLIFAQETAEHETSKTAFYVLGLLAAAWAIALFAIGMRSPDVPGLAGGAARRDRRQRRDRGRRDGQLRADRLTVPSVP